MNRKDRAIADQTDCVQLLRRCDTLRLGLWDGTMPYVVPVSFGMEVIDNQVILYIHGAARGKKVYCLTQHPQVCVEGDIFYKVEPTLMGITARYESVIGFGTAEKVEGDPRLDGDAGALPLRRLPGGALPWPDPHRRLQDYIRLPHRQTERVRLNPDRKKTLRCQRLRSVSCRCAPLWRKTWEERVYCGHSSYLIRSHSYSFPTQCGSWGGRSS